MSAGLANVGGATGLRCGLTTRMTDTGLIIQAKQTRNRAVRFLHRERQRS